MSLITTAHGIHRSARGQGWLDIMPRGNADARRIAFGALAASFDVLMIFLAALSAGRAYHYAMFREMGPTELAVQMGLFVALLFVLTSAVRGDYALVNYLRYSGHVRRSLGMWAVAVLCVLAGGYLTRVATDFSRATTALFFFVGFASLICGRLILVAGMRRSARAGHAPVRRVLLLGTEASIKEFSAEHPPWSNGMRVIADAVLRGPEHLADDLRLAAASARMLRPDDVFILVPWSQTRVIERCVNAFLRVPAAIHLGPERVLERFADARITKLGDVASLNLTRRALNPLQITAKRMFDIVAGTAILILGLPLMILVALAIRYDSPGPIFFFQRRYGFNQEPFRIVKFRSMRTLDDGRVITQATKDDPRITRVGRLLRRSNLDELPQVFNVLAGDMSLIGPRPHAVPHDQQFGDTIALYARRHNVKPGITGWAQVNGLRGETATSEIMQARVEHDLWYIDNWSFMLDMRILVQTVLSRKAYRNAR